MGGEDQLPERRQLSGTDSVISVSGEEREDLGNKLEEFRPYLLAIANSEFPQFLAGNLAPSDAVQVAITNGFHRYHQFRGQTSEELAGWLRQILLNTLKAETRYYSSEKRGHIKEHAAQSDLIDRQLSPSGEAMCAEQLDQLKAALTRLPEIYQQAISLRYSEDLSFGEMGRRLDRSEEAARKLWARAIKQLQQQLGSDDSGQLSVFRGRT